MSGRPSVSVNNRSIYARVHSLVEHEAPGATITEYTAHKHGGLLGITVIVQAVDPNGTRTTINVTLPFNADGYIINHIIRKGR